MLGDKIIGLLSALLLLQTPVGIVTGVVQDSAGTPQPNVRVAAMAPPGTTGGANVLVAISRTDQDGRYRLEVPPGEFFIAAGRVDTPTYYPNSAALATATAIRIRVGSSTDGIDVRASAESLTEPPPQRSFLVSPPVRATMAAPAPPPTNLMPYLTGYAVAKAPSLIFEFVGLTGRTANFKTVSGSFSYGCSGCEFFVRNGGVGPPTGDPGMLFKVAANGQSLDFKCVASQCHVARLVGGSIVVSTLSRDQSAGMQPNDPVAFAVVP